jgi:hypothetical protein
MVIFMSKQKYYVIKNNIKKIIGNGMVQFGVHMHFLHIKQVSAIKYILEIYF